MNYCKILNTKIKLIEIIVLLFCIYISIQLFVPSNIGNINIEVHIPEGSTYRQAIEILSKNRLLRDKNLFLFIGKITFVDKRIKAGYYSFWGNMSPYEIFKKLVEGKIIESNITIIEGDSLSEIAEKLEKNNIMTVETFESLSKNKNFLKSLNIDAPSLEGYLFPETYRIPKGSKPEAVLTLMVNMLRKNFDESMISRMKELNMSENQILTLASIIEKEAVVDEERPIIAAVYHNRLKRGMPLQADPTAIYGIKSYKSKITRRDLQNKTRYNTYVIRGLPPGPICSAGIKSIRAALFPADVPYLYFVSNRDGTHYFSKTLDEHIRAIKRIAEQRQTAEEEG
jgi:UPF0755 protein